MDLLKLQRKVKWVLNLRLAHYFNPDWRFRISTEVNVAQSCFCLHSDEEHILPVLKWLFVLFVIFLVRGLIFDWMEHYRVAVGISPPFRFSSRSKRRAMSHSARSMPGALPSGFEATRAFIRRSPSAPPIPHPKGKSWYRSSSQLGTRPHSSVEKSKVTRIEDSRSVTIEVPTRDMQSSRIASKVPSAVSG